TKVESPLRSRGRARHRAFDVKDREVFWNSEHPIDGADRIGGEQIQGAVAVDVLVDDQRARGIVEGRIQAAIWHRSNVDRVAGGQSIDVEPEADGKVRADGQLLSYSENVSFRIALAPNQGDSDFRGRWYRGRSDHPKESRERRIEMRSGRLATADAQSKRGAKGRSRFKTHNRARRWQRISAETPHRIRRVKPA